MKGLIKTLFKYFFLLILTTSIVFAVGYFYRNKTRGLEQFVQQNIMTYIIEDTTGLGAALDTTLTPAGELELELLTRQREWETRSIRLDSVEQEINARMDSIQAIRQQVESQQAVLDEQEITNLDKLAKLYEAMRPAQASAILMQLNDQTIAEILYRMADRQAGRLMNEIDPLRAADITTRLRRLQQQSRQ
ncbi:MotE family protein [candidate division KSB1 bacterium]